MLFSLNGHICLRFMVGLKCLLRNIMSYYFCSTNLNLISSHLNMCYVNAIQIIWLETLEFQLGAHVIVFSFTHPSCYFVALMNHLVENSSCWGLIKQTPQGLMSRNTHKSNLLGHIYLQLLEQNIMCKCLLLLRPTDNILDKLFEKFYHLCSIYTYI